MKTWACMRKLFSRSRADEAAGRLAAPAVLLAATLAMAAGPSGTAAVQPAGGPSAAPQSTLELAPIELTPERRQLIGLKLATVEEKPLSDRIGVTGFVEADERLEGYVQTRFAGWIRRVYADQTYQYVRKGAPLLTVYSPELASAEREYLLAQRESRALKSSTVEGVAGGAESMAGAALERLRLFGVAPREVRRLEREGTARDEIEIDAPMTGYVIDRQAFANLYATPESRLYTIADLSRVWVYAAVFQNQIGELKAGNDAVVTVDAYPGRRFAGQVDFIWRALDVQTRTARVRCSLPNREGLLKLGMFVNVEIAPRLGRGLVIPDSGVLRTGTHDIAFIDRGGGYLEPVEVGLGLHLGGEFVVRKGLKAGERIVSSANFLIDSESQLQAAMGSFVPPPPGAAGSARAAAQATLEMTTNPSPPRNGRNEVIVTLRDAAGKPIMGADVSVLFFMPAMPDMGMTAMRVTAKAADQGGGTYRATVELGSGGTWQVTLAATMGGLPLAVRQLTVSATGGM